jgi:hypothetical protein
MKILHCEKEILQARIEKWIQEPKLMRSEQRFEIATKKSQICLRSSLPRAYQYLIAKICSLSFAGRNALYALQCHEKR